MVQTAIKKHIDSHQTQGVDWPAWAVHACSTWPCGWEKEPTIRFFANTAELETWMEDYRKWATLEDNYFAYRAYDWDWGPVPSTVYLESNASNIPSGKAYNLG